MLILPHIHLPPVALKCVNYVTYRVSYVMLKDLKLLTFVGICFKQ
jgi:hypothetical protein